LTVCLALWIFVVRPGSVREATLGDDSPVRRLVTGDTPGGISAPLLDARRTDGLAMTSDGAGRCERPTRDGAE